MNTVLYPYEVQLLQDMAADTPVSYTYAPRGVRWLLKRLEALHFCAFESRTVGDDPTLYTFCVLTPKGTTYLHALALEAAYDRR
jgi:hypothetical protein